MFTGIIEALGVVEKIEENSGNLHIYVSSSIFGEIKIDQSIAHNGICLTVDKLFDNSYRVTAIRETLDKTNLKYLRQGDLINLERCMKLDGRLDGHIVQGHVDMIAKVIDIKEVEGSRNFYFEYNHKNMYYTVSKGSICVNGISLTVVESKEQNQKGFFSVSIIPYTNEYTNFKYITKGDFVNIEFDIIGKYIQKLLDSDFLKDRKKMKRP